MAERTHPPKSVLFIASNAPIASGPHFAVGGSPAGAGTNFAQLA